MEPDDINNPIILNVFVLLAGSTSDANTHLLNIGNNTDIIVGTPWLTSHDRMMRDLTNIASTTGGSPSSPLRIDMHRRQYSH
jgi:hypothetical protein